MMIKSYLVFPKKGKKAILKEEIEGMPWCEVTAAENEDVLIMVAETKDKDDEEKFLNELHQMKALQHYSLVSGFNNEE